MLKIYRNTAIFVIVIMIGIQWGFYRTYTSEFPNFINKTTTIHIHGVLLMMWMVLLIVQPLLISTGRAKLHRTVGKVSYVLGPLIIIYLFLIGKGAYGRSIGQISEQENLGTMVLDIRGLVTFAIFWAMAMFYRKDSASHMRYMIATGIVFIGPGVGRGLISLGVEFPTAIMITDLVDLAIVGFLLGYDIYRKKNYKPFLVVFIVFLIGALLWQLRDSAAWQSFAKSYAALFY
jgi:RsiW-degrading membrane proteinase PrsW (M82 family)